MKNVPSKKVYFYIFISHKNHKRVRTFFIYRKMKITIIMFLYGIYLSCMKDELDRLGSVKSFLKVTDPTRYGVSWIILNIGEKGSSLVIDYIAI